MIERDDIGSWLSGPASARKDGEYPGSRIGLPAEGSGSLARPGRRIVALVIDWGLCLLIANWLFDEAAFAILAIFAVENLLLVGTLGSTVGHRIMGLRVIAVDGTWANPLRVLARTALLCLVLPAVIFNADGRGGHDILAGTAIVRR